VVGGREERMGLQGWSLWQEVSVCPVPDIACSSRLHNQPITETAKPISQAGDTFGKKYVRKCRKHCREEE